MTKMTDCKTWLPGKDSALEDSISRMQQLLRDLGFHIEEHSWLNPLPHVWSVHIRDRDCPLLFTNGKGATREATLASALGEYFERLATNYFWADYYLGDAISKQDAADQFAHYANEKWFALDQVSGTAKQQWPEGLLNEELIEFYNPQSALCAADLVDINVANSERGICALPFVRQRDNRTLYFPVNLIGNLYVSNGMSAGNTAAEARVQALSEILERYVKFTIIAEAICLPDVPAAYIERFPRINEAINKLEQHGFGVLVKDASLGGQFPVVNVTLLNSQNQGCYASFGAHPRFEVALERSLTELLQGRELNTLDTFPPPSLDNEEVASAENLETHFIDSSGLIAWNFLSNQPDYEFSPCHFEGDTKEELQWLSDLIHKTGRDIYIADYQHLGMYACRILVPSMSEIYSVDDLVWENNNQGVALRNDILTITRLSPTQAAQLLEALERKEIDDLQPVAALVGLPIQAGTLWQDYRVAELKTLLAAKARNKEALIMGCQWLLGFGQIAESRRQLYHCASNLLSLDETETIEHYGHTLQKLYKPSILENARHLINGDLQDMNLDFTNSLQDSLISAYHKIHKAKIRQVDRSQ